jgi:competence protein ComEC
MVFSVNAALTAIQSIRATGWPAWLHGIALAERGRFMPWLAVLMGAGVVFYFALGVEPPAASGPVLTVGAGVLCWLVWANPVGRGAALAVFAAALGFASAQLATARAPAPLALPRTATIITATVSGVETLPEGRRLTLELARLDDGPVLPRRLHLRLRANDPAMLAAGDTIRVRAVMRPPAPPAYPGAWDLQRDAFFSGLGGGGVALGPVQRLAEAAPFGPARWLQGLRDGIAARFTAGLPGAAGTIAATMLVGNGSAIPLADRAAFRDSGLAHLLAVAGLHIGIVMGLVMGATRIGLALSERAALHWPCKQIAAAAALSAGGAYVLLTGMHVPVLRSFAMTALVTLGIAVGRRAVSLRGLALGAIALMLAAPQEVVGVSFQMSFAAVLALIAGYEALRPVLSPLRRRRVTSHLLALLLTSLLAGVASAPFGAFHFGRVQVYFILANLVAVPLTAMLVMPAGVLALALMPLGLERLALVPMGWGLDAIIWIARSVAALPAATFDVPHIPIGGLVLVALGLAWLGLWRSRMRLAGVPVILAGLLGGLVSPPADLLVSPDARLIALRSPAYVQTRPGFSRFVLDSWSQYWAEPLTASFPESGEPGAVRCDADGCRVEQGAAAVLLARSLHPMDCTGAALVVSAEPARDVCPALPRIDRFTVWRDGAQAVWLRDGAATVLSDRSYRGDRPWVPGPPAPARARVTMPLAQEDDGGTPP